MCCNNIFNPQLIIYVTDDAISTIGDMPANIPDNVLGGAINVFEFIIGPVPIALTAQILKV